jgi:predicted DNA-binding protein
VGKKPSRVIRRPKRHHVGRVLAWGRLYVRPEVVPIVEREAWRVGVSPTGFLAEVIEQWVRKQATGARAWRAKVRRVRQEPTHGTERIRLRLPQRLADRINARASKDGTTVRANLRAAIASGLQNRSAILDAARAPRGVSTYGIGSLPLPKAMATEIRGLAKKLGISTNEVIRRAIESSAKV